MRKTATNGRGACFRAAIRKGKMSGKITPLSRLPMGRDGFGRGQMDGELEILSAVYGIMLSLGAIGLVMKILRNPSLLYPSERKISFS